MTARRGELDQNAGAERFAVPHALGSAATSHARSPNSNAARSSLFARLFSTQNHVLFTLNVLLVTAVMVALIFCAERTLSNSRRARFIDLENDYATLLSQLPVCTRAQEEQLRQEQLQQQPPQPQQQQQQQPVTPFASAKPSVCPGFGGAAAFTRSFATAVQRYVDDVVTYTLFPQLTGPTKQVAGKNLLVGIIGDNARNMPIITRLDELFPLQHFDRLFFVYDGSYWPKLINNNCIVVHVHRQMKWWYIKRLLLPRIARSYSYIYITDEDAEPKFKPIDYIRTAREYNVSLSAPGREGHVSHGFTSTMQAFVEQVGRWTTFVECGPLVVVSGQAYECFWNSLRAEVTSGFGLDYHWCKFGADACGYGPRYCAILDSYVVVHLDTKSAAPGKDKPKYSPWDEFGVYHQGGRNPYFWPFLSVMAPLTYTGEVHWPQLSEGEKGKLREEVRRDWDAVMKQQNAGSPAPTSSMPPYPPWLQ